MSRFTSILLFAVLLWTADSRLSTAADRPNILFIFTDDHAPHAIGAYDGWLKSVNPTPEIDKLAAQGVVFENSFCSNSICGPSRAVIQTGKHSHKNGFMDNGNSFDWKQQTFPKLLQKAGYQTAIYGKSHLKEQPQGYDSWAVLPGQGLYYNPDFLTAEGKKTIEGYCTDLVTDMAVKFLEERDTEKPLMLMVQHKAPHRNWVPTLRHLDLYADIDIPEPATLFDKWEDNARGARHRELEIDRHMHLNFDLFLDLTPEFDGEIEGRFDKSAWRNLQRMTPEQVNTWRAAYGPRDEAFHKANLKGKDPKMDELGMTDNTIVIYSSDQGFYIGDHGWFDKRWMYGESLKMPFIAKWPGVIEPGSRNTNLIQNLDYAETFLDIADAAIPDDMRGASLVSLI